MWSLFFYYSVVGGVASAESVFLRRVKKPTATGTRMAIRERHSMAYPYAGGVCPEEPPNSNVPFPVIVPMPMMQANSAQHPQITAVAMVAIIPVFLAGVTADLISPLSVLTISGILIGLYGVFQYRLFAKLELKST